MLYKILIISLLFSSTEFADSSLQFGLTLFSVVCEQKLYIMNKGPTNASKNQFIRTLIHSYLFRRFRGAI
jgi:hypothetical protein